MFLEVECVASGEMEKVLYSAIEKQDLRWTSELLDELNANPNWINPETGIGPLHLAVGLGSQDILLQLLAFGGNPNHRASDGTTPLHIAAAWGRIKILKILLDNGANPKLEDNEAQSPLECAIKGENKQILNVILEFMDYSYENDTEFDESTENFTFGKLESKDMKSASTEVLATMLHESLQLNEVDLAANWCQKRCESKNSYNQDFVKVPKSTSSEDEYFTCASQVSTMQSSANPIEVYKYQDHTERVTLFEKRLVPFEDVMGSANGKDAVDRLSKLEDAVKGSCSSLPSLHSELGYSSETLTSKLLERGFRPGPILKSTKLVYARQLAKLKKGQKNVSPAEKEQKKQRFSRELERALKDLSAFEPKPAIDLEQVMMEEFRSSILKGRKWRGGHTKSSFTYLLLDPRVTMNLPIRCLDHEEAWRTFIHSIFYIGKGQRSRPYSHLYEAVGVWSGKGGKANTKVARILDIWDSGMGVVCLHLFHSIIPVEALTREAAMIEAIGLENLCNLKGGEFYGKVSSKSTSTRCHFGTYLLLNAMNIFLHEGERQLFPNDIS